MVSTLSSPFLLVHTTLVSFVGFQPKITGVKITANKIQFVNAELSAGVMVDEAEVIEYTVPLIDKDVVHQCSKP